MGFSERRDTILNRTELMSDITWSAVRLDGFRPLHGPPVASTPSPPLCDVTWPIVLFFASAAQVLCPTNQ